MQTRKNLADKEKEMGTITKAFILHGWTYSTEKWHPFINLLKQKGLEVNILKIPGLTEDLNRIWTIEDYVSWLKKTLENNKVILIGHSNGGRIALNFAIKYPKNLESLILIGSAGIYHDELSIKIKRLVFGHIAKAGKKLTSSEKLRSILYKIVGESDYKNATLVMKQTMINLINSDKDLIKHLDKVATPTLIIWGEEDKIIPLSDGRLINKLIKNSELHIIDGAKHSPQFTHPNQVAETIVNNLTI